MDDRVHAHVAYGDAHTEFLAQGGGAGFRPGQVDGLHQGDGLGSAGNPFLHHAVVPGEYQQVGMLDFIMYLPGDARQLNGKGFQPAQTFRRLGQLILAYFCRLHGRLVRRCDLFKQ